MKKIDRKDVYEISFFAYNQRQTGYYVAEKMTDPLIDAERLDVFDDVWNDEHAYIAKAKDMGYVPIFTIDDMDTKAAYLIKEEDILVAEWDVEDAEYEYIDEWGDVRYLSRF